MNANHDKILVRPARGAELPKLAELVGGRLPDLVKSRAALKREQIRKRLAGLVPDEALLLAIEDRELAGMAALDLDHARMLALHLDPHRASAQAARKLIQAVEETAKSFGIARLHCTVKSQAWAFMERLGYQTDGMPAAQEPVALSRDLRQTETPYERQVRELHRQLDIPADYGVRHRLRLVPELTERVSIGLDIFDRKAELSAPAAKAWTRMREDASRHDVQLQPVSAFRGVNYQANLIRRKREANESITQILRVSAAPGYSEHHSGNAIDLGTPGFTPLTREFAETRAYQWLRARAGLYGFHESFPDKNRHCLDWEPWHWCYRSPKTG